MKLLISWYFCRVYNDKMAIVRKCFPALCFMAIIADLLEIKCDSWYTEIPYIYIYMTVYTYIGF
jgi:hypothetical protein